MDFLPGFAYIKDAKRTVGALLWSLFMFFLA
jgi:hypothetical protein